MSENTGSLSRPAAENPQPAQQGRIVGRDNDHHGAIKLEQQDLPVRPGAQPSGLQRISGLTIRDLGIEEWTDILYNEYHVYESLYEAENGDMTLVITGGLSLPSAEVEWEDLRNAITVSSTRMDQALPGWRSNIAKVSHNSGHLPVAELCAGTPQVFWLLAMAAHYNPSESCPQNPSVIMFQRSLEEVRDLLKLSHRYNALHLIATNVHTWKWDVLSLDKDFNSETSNFGQLNYLWIAYELGMEQSFNEMCCNLAYVASFVFWNPDSMPPGIFKEIYRCRQDFLEWSLSQIYDYCEKLTRAVAEGVQSNDSICPWPLYASKCAEKQLRHLETWLDASKLRLSDLVDHRGFLATDRSPVRLFDNHPLDVTTFHDGLHPKVPYNCCGLVKLANEIINVSGHVRLMKWMMQTGGSPQLATKQHMEYMQGQRKKYEER